MLAFLADTQATHAIDEQDAQPGKILHEMRGGEMAALGEVPFGRYYGSVDATPLFVMLAHAYYERTGDRAFIDRIWPNIARGARLDATPAATSTATASSSTPRRSRRRAGAPGLEGLARLRSSTPTARWPKAPIALCEVQGYVYAAWHGAAQLAAVRGDGGAADDVVGARRARARSASSRRSGAKTLAPTRWRSTATSARAACAARTPVTACSPASSRPSAPGAWPRR